MRVGWNCCSVAELTQFEMRLVGPVRLVLILLPLVIATAFQSLAEAG